MSILSQLFVDTKDPTYIYNQGRCLEQNAKYEEALSRFREYLRVAKNLSDSDRTEAESHISDCQGRINPSSLTPPTAPLTQPPPPPPTEPLPRPANPPPEIQRPRQPVPAATNPGSGLRTAGIVVASVGGAALVAGIILNLKVNSMASDFQNLNGYTDSKESDRKSFETLGWVSYGVGAACVATGSVLYVLGLRAGRQSSASIALLPTLVPGGAAALVKGAF
jgi:hypothetical protein